MGTTTARPHDSASTGRVSQSSHETALLRYARSQRDVAAERAGKLVAPQGSDVASLDAAERRSLDGHLGEFDRWQARVGELEASLEQRRVSVISEPLTYAAERRGTSFFADLIWQARGGSFEAVEAGRRLERHRQEMRVELPLREQRMAREYRASLDGLGVEYGREDRASGRLAGFGGYFAPPLWLIDEFATGSRPGRLLADLVPGFPLPDGVSSVRIPRFVTPTAVGPAADSAATASNDLTDAEVASPCAPIAGHSDVSLAMLDQSPAAVADIAIWKDLSEAYDAQLERMLINGTGTSSQFTGLLNLPTGVGNVNAITYTDAAPTGPRMFPFFGNAAAQIGDNRLMPPECWLMRTARWAWLGCGEDAQGLPLATPGHMPPPRATFTGGRPAPVAPLLGWPIFPDDAIPADLGAAQNQDAIIACRPSDALLFESAPVVSVGTETLSGILGARVTFRGYAAFLGGRRPTGIATITGTGLVVQAGE